MIDTGWLPWVVAAWLFGVGLYGIISSRHYVHLIGCLAVVQSATYVLLLSIGYRHGAGRHFFIRCRRGRRRSTRSCRCWC